MEIDNNKPNETQNTPNTASPPVNPAINQQSTATQAQSIQVQPLPTQISPNELNNQDGQKTSKNSNNTTSDNPPRSKRKWIIALSLILILPLLLILSSFNKYTIYTPTYVPTNFEAIIKSQGRNAKGNEQFSIDYFDQTDGVFAISQTKNEVVACKPPSENSNLVVDYAEFTPTNSSGGCAFTIDGKVGGIKKAYNWQLGETKMMIFVDNNSLTTEEVLKVANSLQLESTYFSKSLQSMKFLLQQEKFEAYKKALEQK